MSGRIESRARARVTALRLLFMGMVAGMLLLTTRASLERDLVGAGGDLWGDAWFRATLFDAYFAFATILAWILYKERTTWARLRWTILVLGLGTIATSAYVLIQLHRLRPGDPIATVLLRSADPT